MTEKKLICVYLFIFINRFGHLEMPQGKAEVHVNKCVNDPIKSWDIQNTQNCGKLRLLKSQKNQTFYDIFIAPI